MNESSSHVTPPAREVNIASRHFYRFEYLKSEHWNNLRLSKLASVDACCERCGIRNLSNDVHHVNYKNLFDVKEKDLVVLCRECHEKVHEYLDRVKSGELKDHHEWLGFIELWGENPSRIPALWKTISDFRKAGKIPINLAGNVNQKITIKIKTNTLEINRFSDVAKKSGILIEDWMLALARAECDRHFPPPILQ